MKMGCGKGTYHCGWEDNGIPPLCVPSRFSLTMVSVKTETCHMGRIIQQQQQLVNGQIEIIKSAKVAMQATVV